MNDLALPSNIMTALAKAQNGDDTADVLAMIADVARAQRLSAQVRSLHAKADADELDVRVKEDALLAAREEREAKRRKEEQERMDAAARRQREADLHELAMLERKAALRHQELAAQTEAAKVRQAEAEESRKNAKHAAYSASHQLLVLTVKEAILGIVKPTQENPYRAMAALAYRVHLERQAPDDAIRSTVELLAMKTITMEEGLAYYERWKEYVAQQERDAARREEAARRRDIERLIPPEELNNDEA